MMMISPAGLGTALSRPEKPSFAVGPLPAASPRSPGRSPVWWGAKGGSRLQSPPRAGLRFPHLSPPSENKVLSFAHNRADFPMFGSYRYIGAGGGGELEGRGVEFIQSVVRTN